MRHSAPFRRSDLLALSELLDTAEEVVAMREIAAGELHPNVIGLRHDMDNTLEPSVQLAAWEASHGYRSTYFVLHDSPYWNEPGLREALETIVEFRHEVGIHVNAIAVALRTGREPDEILESALERIRGWGIPVTGVVAHGDPACYGADGELLFVNDEIFEECARPMMGRATRTLRRGARSLQLRPRRLADYGLEYESTRTGARALYLTDSGGRWHAVWSARARAEHGRDFTGTARTAWRELLEAFPSEHGQLHVLTHPCWWIGAFPQVKAAA